MRVAFNIHLGKVNSALHGSDLWDRSIHPPADNQSNEAVVVNFNSHVEIAVRFDVNEEPARPQKSKAS